MQRVRQTNLAVNPDSNWLACVISIGNDETTASVMIRFSKFAELDEWSSDHEILQMVLGEAQASRLLAALASITDSESSPCPLIESSASSSNVRPGRVE